MTDFERAERATMGTAFLAIGIVSVVKGVKGARARAAGRAEALAKVETKPKMKSPKVSKHKYVPGKSKVAKMARRSAKRDVKKAKPKVERKVGKRAKEKKLNNSKKAANHQKRVLISELKANGVRFNANDVVRIEKLPDGKIVWIENGNSKAGLNHVKTHAPEFLHKGIPEAELADFIIEAILKGKIIDYQGKGSGRPIYEFTWKGKQQKVAITVGNNGFVVGANPK